ncbi:MAG: MaoC family dehydratase N-terminal domain-containing protein [Halioglobus sp.]|nr:MaoC family dehydratase N-terminal domain-containing protein [Halioglobus sp.]
MDLNSYIGKPTGAGTVHVERGAVSRFAAAVTDDNALYHDLNAAKGAGFNGPPVPPTWTFASVFQGRYPEEQPEDPTGGTGNPMMQVINGLMKTGGLVLHGEQEFRYHQSVQCGDVLHWEGKITDIYAKESKGKTMTFIVTQTVFSNQAGEPVVTEIFNLIHRGA